MISEDTVCTALAIHNINLVSICSLSDGSNHIVFSGKTDDNKELIIKFPTVRQTELQFCSGNRDTMFGGELSLDRESYLLGLISELGLPAPEVYGIIPTPVGNCIIVERLPGCNLVDYMKNNQHSIHAFLMIAQNLGNDLRQLHQANFNFFGNIMADSVIDPPNITNFADRYQCINNMLLEKCLIKGGLNDLEYIQVQGFFTKQFKSFYSRLDIKNSPSTVAITDLHGGNFFISDDHISGYFDVESSQAAPCEFELYSLRFFVFNYYSQEEYQMAEKTFWSAYYNNGRTAPDSETDALIDFFSACRLLEIFQSYWGHKDGLRDTWGQRIKEILFDYIQTGSIDYLRLGKIWRERDGQPINALEIPKIKTV